MFFFPNGISYKNEVWQKGKERDIRIYWNWYFENYAQSIQETKRHIKFFTQPVHLKRKKCPPPPAISEPTSSTCLREINAICILKASHSRIANSCCSELLHRKYKKRLSWCGRCGGVGPKIVTSWQRVKDPTHMDEHCSSAVRGPPFAKHGFKWYWGR
jgi:hypothetical protein